MRTYLFLLAGLALGGATAGGGPKPARPPDPAPWKSAPAVRPGISAGNVFFYYSDLNKAWAFYRDVFGFETVADYGTARILRVAPASYLTLVNAARGMHTAEEPKTVALALLTEDVEGWAAHLQERGVPFKYALKVRPGSAHDGCVALDPEGYFLEIERFNPHPENERLMPVWKRLSPLRTEPAAGVPAPPVLGFKGTVVWLYYPALAPLEKFYEETLGLALIVDQGWAKIYPASPTAFIGLVDGARGMHKPTPRKGVTVSFFVRDIRGWFEALSAVPSFRLRKPEIEANPRFEAFVGYDPEGYFLEFDAFRGHPDNRRLLECLAGR